MRFAVEVMEAIAGAIGAGLTGLRLSPVTPANDAAPDSQSQALLLSTPDDAPATR